jgi:hydroxyacyl-ACP dehydratase HTD2-like protein with hotdog domain
MAGIDFSNIKVGDVLPEREHVASNVSLFLYNAAVWNPHRIHYDETYTTQQEQHPGIVIDGPLQGDWLSQCPLNWLGDQGELIAFNYSNRKAAYLGETLVTGGSVIEIDKPNCIVVVELFVKNEAGEVITPGSARLKVVPGT